ncbi:unnamed protein product, partial [Angiostrongylus costaricensis]|uniref:Myeloid leukemia factor n=1 Tax=Angiostrongylus costaricensis TaxID=334426 RepID=A0A0R3PWL5_ANGCS
VTLLYQGPLLGSPSRQLARPFDPFRGFGGLFSAMVTMSDPRSHVYSQSTMVSFGSDGQPRVVENSLRKSGDVKETRRRVRDGAREELAIGHTIGDRTHIIEKKRDKDGKVRRQQRFVNLDEGRSFLLSFFFESSVNLFVLCTSHHSNLRLGSIFQTKFSPTQQSSLSTRRLFIE